MKKRRDQPVEEEPQSIKSFDDFDTTLGDIMRGERATMGKSLLDVQRDLKIKAAYIAAIENSDPTAFETQGFVAGYVRSYARYLGMDPEAAFETFCRESNFETVQALVVGSGSKSSIKSKISSRAGADPLAHPAAPYLPEVAGRFSEIEPRALASLAVLVALVLGLGYGGWSVLQEIQKVRLAPVAQSPGVISSVDPLASVGADPGEIDLALSVETSAPPAETLDRLYRPQALESPILVARDGPISAVDPEETGAFAGLSQRQMAPETAPEIVPALPVEQVVQETPPVQVIQEGPPEVVLFAVRPAWVRVQGADGSVLFEKILDAGERYVVPVSDTPARLRAGNSGSVYFELKGQTYGPVGDSATVAKNVSLGADDVLETYAIADIESDPALKRIISVANAARADEGE